MVGHLDTRRGLLRLLVGLPLVGGFFGPPSAGHAKTARRLANDRLLCPENECGFIYDPAKGDPASGIPPGVPFEDLPPDWICPVCGRPHHRWL